jgi:hypothetical protein
VLQLPFTSFNAMSINSPPELKSLFETALNEFEKRAGTSLAQNQIVTRLAACGSADSVIDVLQEQAQAFRNFRGDNGKIMTWVKRTVNVVYALSTSEMLSGAISTVCVGLCPLPITLAYAGTAVLQLDTLFF